MLLCRDQQYIWGFLIDTQSMKCSFLTSSSLIGHDDFNLKSKFIPHNSSSLALCIDFPKGKGCGNLCKSNIFLMHLNTHFPVRKGFSYFLLFL
jgi:hypothetical protein